MALQVSQDLRRTLDDLGRGFLTEFLEVEIERHPQNIQALAELGQLYTQAGECHRGLEVDLQLVKLVPTDATAHYNLACSYALLGRPDESLGALGQAIALGYHDHAFMLRDEDLRSLREDPRFLELLDKLRL